MLQTVPIEIKCQSAIRTLKKGMKEMEEWEFTEILEELCNEMNLQIKPKPVERKKGVVANTTTDDDSGKSQDGVGGISSRPNPKGGKKCKNQGEQDMDLAEK